MRADRVFALVPLEPAERGDGRRTYVHVDGITEPLVASRSERAILADVEAALDRGRRRPAAAGAAPKGQETLLSEQALAAGRPGADYAQPPVSFYVTTPIYYVNAEPHLGHAYSTIAADILARHMRQRGEDVFFLTGTDEHGEPVAQAAEREGITPQELVDRNAPRFREHGRARRRLERLLHPHHRPRARSRGSRRSMQRVHDNGHVYEGIYEGWYCPRCADFKTEAELGPGNTCPIHEIPLEREREENWFFRLSRLPGAARAPLRRAPGLRAAAVSPQRGALVHQGRARGRLALAARSSPGACRCRGTPSQVMYVWFDALLNYYTALSYAREGEDLTERFWPASLHIIGKDILKFHAVYWPALPDRRRDRAAAARCSSTATC